MNEQQLLALVAVLQKTVALQADTLQTYRTHKALLEKSLGLLQKSHDQRGQIIALQRELIAEMKARLELSDGETWKGGGE